MNKWIWAVALKNSISIICWCALAWFFDRWWIALFGALFLTTTETKRIYYRVCDGCGRRSRSADNYNDALDNAIYDGWLRVKCGDKFEDYCPECRAKVDAVNVAQAHWIADDDYDICSHCNNPVVMNRRTPDRFCKNCGAMMNGEKK